MRPLLPVLLASLLLAAPAAAQTTGPSGATGPAAPAIVPPTATTDGATDVSRDAATAKGRVNPGNGASTVHFEYGTSTGYGLRTPDQTVPAGSTPVAVSARLSRLTTATTYHVRVVATNAAGVARGADRTFKTASAPARPGVVSEAARDITPDAATLAGRIDPNKQVTTYVFQWGTTTRYGRTTPTAGAGAGDTGTRVTARLTGLTPDTTYAYRIRATNAAGTTTGPNRTFRTAKLPLGLRATASPSPVRYGRTLTITGTVTGSGVGNVPVTLERRNFPFEVGFTPFGAQQRTSSSGVVTFAVPPFTLASQFRLVAPTRGGVVSNVAEVQVRAAVILRVRRISRGRLRLTGTVTPANAAGRVSLQRKGADGRYVLLKRVRLVQAGGVRRFKATLRQRRTTTTYRAATRLTGVGVLDGRSSTIRLAARP